MSLASASLRRLSPRDAANVVDAGNARRPAAIDDVMLAGLRQSQQDHADAVRDLSASVFGRLADAFADPDEQGYVVPPPESASPCSSSPNSPSALTLSARCAEVDRVLREARRTSKWDDSVAAPVVLGAPSVTLEVDGQLEAALGNLALDGRSPSPLSGGVVALLNTARDVDAERLARSSAPPTPRETFSLADAGLDSLPAFLSPTRSPSASVLATASARPAVSEVPLTRQQMKARARAACAGR